ncbi:MAG: PucR family transcriptional regulator, partial [Microthrixaceae bacterium]
GEPGSPEAAPRSFKTAGHALAQTVTGSPVASWLEGVRRGVFSILDRERAAAFSVTFLAPLEAEGTDLTQVLSSYLRHNASVSQVAAELGLHRNTVRHRLQRVEQLLERSLDEPQLRLDAWVALQMRTTSQE